MPNSQQLLNEHGELTRRYFLGLSAAAVAAVGIDESGAAPTPELREALAKLEYLTHSENFRNFGRGNPPPHTLPADKRREVGMDRETWQLEVVPDPETDAKVDSPLSRERGTALTWNDLMALAREHAVCYLHVMTCLNVADPCGMGLWEGVPLRVVVWKARPVGNIRRVFYHGYHNDDPKQLFQSSLPFGRVLEDPPGEPPVILCYKLNGQWLSPERGGPVRMLVPDAYGFKSVKWLNRVVLSNLFHANDTYAGGNNDIDTWLKTFARFLSYPKTARAGQPLPVTGLAQVGIAGLSAVQAWLHPAGAPLPADDPYLTKGDWKPAELLGPPAQWGGGLPEGKLPLGFDPKTGKPKEWPMRFALAHWAALLPGVPAGTYALRCRTIDVAGHAQPMPRPFPKSGQNPVHRVQVQIEG